ncbi:hypothetical protein THAOC_17632, partial [Thalassiosira oceanica]
IQFLEFPVADREQVVFLLLLPRALAGAVARLIAAVRIAVERRAVEEVAEAIEVALVREVRRAGPFDGDLGEVVVPVQRGEGAYLALVAVGSRDSRGVARVARPTHFCGIVWYGGDQPVRNRPARTPTRPTGRHGRPPKDDIDGQTVDVGGNNADAQQRCACGRDSEGLRSAGEELFQRIRSSRSQRRDRPDYPMGRNPGIVVVT